MHIADIGKLKVLCPVKLPDITVLLNECHKDTSKVENSALVGHSVPIYHIKRKKKSYEIIKRAKDISVKCTDSVTFKTS